MIPKIIHYCWFGRNPLPKSAKKFIVSWKKYLPDYEIKEWNEDNFDVNIIPYTRDAYEARKYAFVSDYARFWILYHFGGVYFDTDVELIKPLDEIITRGAFIGWERPSSLGSYSIAPGLGLAANQKEPFYKEVLTSFEKLSFYKKDGTWNNYTMIPMVTDLLLQRGLKKNGSLQVINNITIYPADYFCPMDALTGKLYLTTNTFTIHWYSMSWLSKRRQWRIKIMRFLRRFLERN